MTTLRRRMMEDMQVRSLSPQTQATYVQQVSLFARHFNRSPELLGPEEIRGRVGRLRKAAIRWTRAGIGLRRALYSSGGDLQ
jgi:integrase/recombinase XerD